MFGSPKIPAPPVPAPPPNPPTYASKAAVAPSVSTPGLYQGLGSTILTSPMGAPDSRSTQRKTLLGQ